MSDIDASSRPLGGSDGNGASSVQDKVQGAAGQAQEKAQETADKVQGSVQHQVEQRAQQAGERVSGTAEDLRSVGEELRKQGKDGPAKLADRAAEQTEKVGSYLSSNGPEQMLHDIEDFGRERPWALMAGGLVVGAVAARFLKASSGNRYRSRVGGGTDAAGGYKGGAGYRANGEVSDPRVTSDGANQPPPPPRISADRTGVQSPADTGGARTPTFPEPTGSPVVGP
jgi:hypothetical protein